MAASNTSTIQPATAGASPPGRTVLLVDDDKAVLHSLSVLLEDMGFRVVTASDGVEGLRKFRANLPDVTLTDIIMPNREGIETIMQMRRAQPGAKIIAMSGGGRVGNTDFLEIASKLGADFTLAKPFDGDLLIETIQKAIKAKPQIRAAAAAA